MTMTGTEILHWQGNFCDIELPASVVSRVPASGNADAAIAELMKRDDVQEALATVPFDKMVSELEQTGAWTFLELIGDERATKERFLWIVALDLQDEHDEYDEF